MVLHKGKTADIAVILGSKVNEDGTLSERLKKRLECGISLYHNGRAKKLMVSGGLGKEGFYAKRSSNSNESIDFKYILRYG